MKGILFFIIIIFLILPFVQNSYAQSPMPVKYDLPYPGSLLPDNPLYKLTVLRDKIILYLTSDVQKKAEYHLLLADKKIQLAQILLNKGKIDLAKDTALKAEDEITRLTFELKDKYTKPSKDLYDKLQRASQKHQEILTQMINKVGSRDKKTFEMVLEFSKRNADQLKTIYTTY